MGYVGSAKAMGLNLGPQCFNVAFQPVPHQGEILSHRHRIISGQSGANLSQLALLLEREACNMQTI
jgi:hypothetical protein